MSAQGSGPIVSRYAKALFGLAEKRGALDQVARDVERLAGEVRSPAVAKYLMNPRLERSVRLGRLDPILKSAHPLVKNFVSLLFGRGREAVLIGIGPAFHRLRLEAAGVVEGVAETARPIAQAELDSLATRLGAKLQKRVVLTNQVVPDLIGGVRVTVGSQRLDQSVSGRLAGLRRKLMDAPLPSRAS